MKRSKADLDRDKLIAEFERLRLHCQKIMTDNLRLTAELAEAVKDMDTIVTVEYPRKKH